MLSKSSESLVANDVALPGLNRLLDPDLFLEGWCPHHALAGDGASIVYVQYKPGRRCVVMYATENGSRSRWVIATAHNQESWRKHLQTWDWASAGHDPRTNHIFSSECISVVEFPSDRKLRLLSELHEISSAKKLVRSLIRHDIDDRVFRVKCVAYKPGRRAVYDVQASEDRRYALKLYSRPGFELAKARAESWAQSRSKMKDKRIRLPKLLRIDSRRRVLVSRWLPGESLATQMSRQTVDHAIFRKVGKVLRKLHRCNLQGLPESNPLDQRVGITRMAKDIATIAPEHAAVAMEYACEINDSLIHQSIEKAPLHGDFDAKQICIDQSSIGFLDFDRSSYGDPLSDVGNFVAKLQWDALCQRHPRIDIQNIERAFLAGYQKGNAPIEESALELNIAIGLFKCATDPFRSGMFDWKDRMGELLQQVSFRIPRHRRLKNRPVRVKGEAKQGTSVQTLKKTILADCPPQCVVDALTPERAIEIIRRCIPPYCDLGSKLHLWNIEPIGYKAGRRGIIRYDLRIPQSQSPDKDVSIVGKLRLKGVDRHGFAIQQQLYEGGFNESNVDKVAVPKPLGINPDARIWFQEYVFGQSLEERVAAGEGICVAEQMSGIASALTDLHRVDLISELKHYTVTQEVEALCQRLSTVAREQPDLKSMLDAVANHAVRLSAELPDQPIAGIHRDFHPAQVILAGKHLYLIDFDLYCRGPLLLDAGNFVAHLRELALRKPEQADDWLSASQKFRESYLDSLHPLEVKRSHLDAWTWLALARHIWISTKIPDRQQTTRKLADAVLDFIQLKGDND